MLRYFSALNSFGDSGGSGFLSSCAAPDITTSTHAAAVAKKTVRAEAMRASLSSADDAIDRPRPRACDCGAFVADRHVRVHLRDGAVSERARIDDRADPRW